MLHVLFYFQEQKVLVSTTTVILRRVKYVLSQIFILTFRIKENTFKLANNSFQDCSTVLTGQYTSSHCSRLCTMKKRIRFPSLGGPMQPHLKGRKVGPSSTDWAQKIQCHMFCAQSLAGIPDRVRTSPIT